MSSPSSNTIPSGSTIFSLSMLIILSLRQQCQRRKVNLLSLMSEIFSTSAASTASNQKVLKRISSQESLSAYWEKRDGENVFLEEVLGSEALQWVKDKNDKCLSSLGDPTQNPLYDPVLSILESKDKIPQLRKIGSYYYNFWTDEVGSFASFLSKLTILCM